MASAYFAGRSWVAKFKPLNATVSRPQRIPIDQVPGADTPANREAAVAYATECDRYCRRLELAKRAPDIDHAELIRAITPEQAAALRNGTAPITEVPKGPPSIETLALAHPSSLTESLSDQKRHLDELRKFLTWADITTIDQLRLDLVTSWIARLTKSGFAWDTRRHALLWLRRAAAVAPTYGMPDVLAGFKLDRKPEAADDAESTWTIDDLARAAWRLRPQPGGRGNVRARAALALCGFMGLRGTEAARSDNAWFQPDIPAHFIRKSKTRAGIRGLAIPSIVLPWILAIHDSSAPTQPLIRNLGHRRGSTLRFSQMWWGKWLGDIMETATGKRYPAKFLRKSFATWTDELRVDERWIEAYLGHQTKRLAKVTGDAYRFKSAAVTLLPAAAELNRHIQAAMRRVLGHPPLLPQVATRLQPGATKGASRWYPRAS